MRDEDFVEESGSHDDEDRGIRRFQFAGLWMLTYFLVGACWCLSDNVLLNILLLFVPPILSLTWVFALNLLSSIPSSLFLPSGYTHLSFEMGLYQNDMDRAKKLVREERWSEAITFYREIVQRFPKQCEPKFNLARLYQKMGYEGLALKEYHKIVDQREERGASRVLVSESERAMKELKYRSRPEQFG